LLNPENFEEAKKILRSEDFSDFTYRSIYSVCEKIYHGGDKITSEFPFLIGRIRTLESIIDTTVQFGFHSS